MDPTFFLYVSSSERDGEEKIVRRQLREKSNSLALPNTAFLKRFRLTKEAFEFVLQEINLTKSDTKAVPPVLQLAATLSLLASGGYQHIVGSDYLIGMGQSTVSKLTSHVLKEMERKLCPQLIRFAPEDSLGCKEWFVEQYKVPGGCVDGTHIGLQKPTANEHMYFNRKGYHSINAMVVSSYYNILLE
ncbi:putative nuclease HARBI1 [Anastrepha obliqua]|uniref:putative nuclease HARBI1 n=1 Tax=Anastrepha obliqua TaxID=95512 RepID=UPI00240A1285|nr:putative nuclease HARBI1 [Anastrepha obliqua]